jgi:prepilin-type N-terminal cleavage/methylation domain-containing protein
LKRGFTLIEVMIVIGIAALVMAVGVPFVYNVLHRDPFRQAVADIMEACSHTRAQAIFSGTTAELRILPRERLFQAGTGGSARKPSSEEIEEPTLSTRPPASPPAKAFSAHISDDIIIELLDVNFHPYKDAEEARVRFFPNGTSDEFTIVLQYAGQQWRKISLDPVTGMADMGVIK